MAHRERRTLALVGACLLLVASPEAQEAKWWKGNLHTRTLWSDGDQFPEMVVDWYKYQGDELYVRARVISTKLKDNPYREGETEAAWLQPIFVSRSVR